MAAAEALAMPIPAKEGPKKKDEKKRRGSRASGRRKEKTAEAAPEEETKTFDCSGAISQITEGLWACAVSGTRMGASLEAALLECGVTAVLSTSKEPQKSETFEHRSVEMDEECLRPLHDACDFINEAVTEGGVVFIHSRAGFARSDWAVLVALGYLVKYKNFKLSDAMETLAETTKHAVAPPGKYRKDLVTFEEEARGEASVSEDWVAADQSSNGSKNHSLSRRKLAENLNDRRLLKKKSPHK